MSKESLPRVLGRATYAKSAVQLWNTAYLLGKMSPVTCVLTLP